MAFPRRFYLVVFLAVFALLSSVAVLGRGRGRGILDVSGGLKSGSGGGTSAGREGVVKEEEKKKKEEEEASSSKTIAGNMVATLVGGGNGQNEQIPSSPSQSSQRKELRVAVVESSGRNEEVTAALVYAFGRQALSPLSLYTLEQRFGMGEIMGEFNLSTPMAANKSTLDFGEAVKGPGFPQLLVSSSCEVDLVRLSDPFDVLLKGGKTYLYCVVHDADAWREGEVVERIRPWIQQEMVGFVALSTHTAHHLRTQAIANWDFNATVTVQWLPPVFPVNMPEPVEEKAVQTSNNFPFALYTDADPDHNNYTDIFNSLSPVLEQAKNVTNDVDTQQSRNVQLHLLGRHKAPRIPSALRRNVVYNPTQSYKEYYARLSQTFALLPYLPLPTYLTSRASSAITAALIAGASLVGNVELLQAYSYVPQDAVWMSTIGEGEMDTATRVVQWSVPEHWRKRMVVRKRCEGILRRNEEAVAGWVEQARRRIERVGWRMGGAGDL